MRSVKMALPLIAALLAAASAQADPVKIRVSYVVAPSDWAPLLPEKPALGFVKAPIDVRKYTDLSLIQEAAARLKRNV